MLKVSQDTILINQRFFTAIDMLKKEKAINGIRGFALKYNISAWNLYTIRNNNSGAIKAEYLSFLVRDFNISPEWLLTGHGGMTKQTIARIE